MSLMDLFLGTGIDLLAIFLELVEEAILDSKRKLKRKKEGGRRRGVPGRGLDPLEEDKKKGNKNFTEDCFKASGKMKMAE